jgi:ferrous iron transport protein A
MPTATSLSTPSNLAQAAIGAAFVVHRVTAPADAPEWAAWLEEIGFLPGEAVCVMARGLPGGDPLVVRIGQSTFALRRAEAACIAISPPTRVNAAPNLPLHTAQSAATADAQHA